MKHILFCFLFYSLNSFAQGVAYFKLTPEQSILKVIEPGPAENTGALRFDYFWATWCGPCHLSTHDLMKLQQEHPKNVQVVAYSDESEDKIKSFLKDKFGDKIPFKYAQIATKKKSKKTDLINWVVGYPHVFVSHQGKLVWQGNPTYPVENFKNFLEMWFAGKWTPDYVKSQNMNSESEALEKIKKVEEASKEVRAQDLKLHQQMAKDYGDLFQETKNYVYFRHMIHSKQKAFELEQYLIGGKEDYLKLKKDFFDERTKDFKGAADKFAGKKEDLYYIARDLIFEEKEYQDTELAEQILAQAEGLSNEGVNYPDYHLWVKARWHMLKGNWSKAEEYNQKAIETCPAQVQCKNFLEYYKQSEKEIQERLKTYCDGTISCLKKAFRL